MFKLSTRATTTEESLTTTYTPRSSIITSEKTTVPVTTTVAIPNYSSREVNVDVVDDDDDNGSGSGFDGNYKNDGSNVDIDLEIDSDDEDYEYKDFKEGSGDERKDDTYDTDTKDSVASGNVSTLSQEEMEEIRYEYERKIISIY